MQFSLLANGCKLDVVRHAVFEEFTSDDNYPQLLLPTVKLAEPQPGACYFRSRWSSMPLEQFGEEFGLAYLSDFPYWISIVIFNSCPLDVCKADSTPVPVSVHSLEVATSGSNGGVGSKLGC